MFLQYGLEALFDEIIEVENAENMAIENAASEILGVSTESIDVEVGSEVIIDGSLYTVCEHDSEKLVVTLVEKN